MKSLRNKSVVAGLGLLLLTSIACAQNFSDVKPSAQQTACHSSFFYEHFP